jgi:hypothetical protein
MCSDNSRDSSALEVDQERRFAPGFAVREAAFFKWQTLYSAEGFWSERVARPRLE